MLTVKRKKGFTLIELLVVVSIIGLLASVIMASLNSSRTKAQNSAIKANLSAMRSPTELIFSTTFTYDTVCDPNITPGEQFRAAFLQSARANSESMCLPSGTTVFHSVGGNIVTTLTKTATPGKWAASVRMRNGNYFCVDYSGLAREQATRGIDNSPLDVDC